MKGEATAKIRVDCKGIVGRVDLGEGLVTLFDTGRKVPVVDMAEAVVLRSMALSATDKTDKADIINQIADWTARIAKTVGVYPIGIAWIMDDGRVVVTEPWFMSLKEGNK